MDLFLTKPSQNINWWTGVVWIIWGLLWCFYHLFGLSFWRHPFTAEDPLMSKWCDATFLQNWWRNKLIYILDGLRGIHFQQIFIFCVNCSFICTVFVFFLVNVLLLTWFENMDPAVWMLYWCCYGAADCWCSMLMRHYQGAQTVKTLLTS